MVEVDNILFIETWLNMIIIHYLFASTQVFGYFAYLLLCKLLYVAKKTYF